MLIFDSGVGGLYVLKSIKKILPKINYIYLMDNQCFPYGNKNELFIIERSIKIINTVKKKYPIRTVIIACNTASTISLSILRKKFSFPIFGIFPKILLSKKIIKNEIFGLIATEATINSSYIKEITHKYFLQNRLKIIATNKLAKIAEQKTRGLLISNIELREIFKPWMNLLIKPNPIILGCTHFLLLKEDIRKILNQKILFIDSTQQIIQDIKKNLNEKYINQNIKKNILLFSKKNTKFNKLISFLNKYTFQKIEYINLN